MSAGTFGLYTTLGVIPWTAALAILGYTFGANWDHVAKDFNGPTYAIAGILVIGLVVVIVRRRRAKAAASAVPGVRAAAYEADGPDTPANPASQAQVAMGSRQGRPSGPGSYAPQDPWAPPPADYQPNPAARRR
jgi:hypothetical protein